MKWRWLNRRRCRPLQIVFFLLVANTLIVLTGYQVFVAVDAHQLSTYNTDAHPSWKSRTWELLEDFYHFSAMSVHYRAPECQHCMQRDFPEVLTPKEVCQGSSDPDILLLIFSAIGEQRDREVVRRTWLQAAKMNTGDVRYIFLVGSHHWGPSTEQDQLAMESKHYGDILQNDYVDSYRNMTIKTLAGLKWAVKHCKQVQYVMKVDTDIYLNMPKWWQLMFGPEKELLKNKVFGHCRRTPPVIRTPYHRYGISVDTFADWRHPSFCRGPSYAMTWQLAAEVVNQSYRQPFIPVEDAYLGHCIRSLRKGIYNPPDINMLDLREVRGKIDQRPCSLVDEFYTIHAVSSDELLELWQLASTCKAGVLEQ